MRVLLALMILVAGLASPARAASEGIAAVVNQDIITMTDLNERIYMIMVSSGLPRSPEIRDKLLPQVLSDLIDEQLKLQEARKHDLTATMDDVNKGLLMLAEQNKMTIEQFIGAMQHDGISKATIERQVKAQLSWSNVIQEVMRDRVTVTDSDIDDYLARLAEAKGKPEYQVAEIYLPVTEETGEAATQQLANKLVNEIKGGAPFFKVAQQFSGAAGAEKGGDLGWVQQGQLQPELDSALPNLQKDTVSQPIRTADGYHILYLRNSRTTTDESIPPRDKIYSTIGIQRLERMQAKELMDLRSTAFIENRVQS